MQKDKEKIIDIHEHFLNEVTKIEEIYINGDLSNKVPGILNVSFNFIEGESLIRLKDVVVSSGSDTSASLNFYVWVVLKKR